MSDRRDQERPESRDRRSFPRPPLWLNLLLLLLGVALLVYARQHREKVAKQFAHVIQQEQRTPEDVRKLKEQLAESEMTKEALAKELQGRNQLVSSLKSEDFHLAIDTKARKIRFYYGDAVLREGEVIIGEQKQVTANGNTWTFVPVKGAFPIQAKYVSYDWPVPPWVYAMNQLPVPEQPVTVPEGLGKYVLMLPNGYAIHTQPSADSPLKGAKPGSYLVPDAFLAAIWPRIRAGNTQVFIY
jgi:hypothetical protein